MANNKVKEITPTQQVFADEFIKTGNKRQSALKARPDKSPEVASVTANRWLQNDNVRTYIKSHAETAVQNVMELANNANNEGVRLSANKDILDRAGYKPVDELERQQLPENNVDQSEYLQAIAKAIKDGDTVELQRIVLKAS